MRELKDVLADLPEIAAAVSPVGEPVLVKRGVKGYWPMPEGMTVALLNEAHEITAVQAQAMLNGSLFGFDVPLADPGNPVVAQMAARTLN